MVKSLIVKGFGISVFAFLIFIVLGFFQEEKQAVEDVQDIETSKIVSSSSLLSHSEKKETSTRDLKTQAQNSISHFDISESFEILKKQVLESGSYISIKKQREDFQNSEFDTVQNAESAKQLLLDEYPDEMDEEFVTRRVLATYFLKLSKHLNSEDCMNFTNTLVKQYESIEDEAHKRALKFDLGSVAYMCSETGGESFHKRISDLKNPALKAQAFNAFQVKQEHLERAE